MESAFICRQINENTGALIIVWLGQPSVKATAAFVSSRMQAMVRKIRTMAKGKLNAE
jgi:hypothetical protein